MLTKKCPHEGILNQIQQNISSEKICLILEQMCPQLRKHNADLNPLDVSLTFKLLMLQKLYKISDEALMYPVNDRLSFIY